MRNPWWHAVQLMTLEDYLSTEHCQLLYTRSYPEAVQYHQEYQSVGQKRLSKAIANFPFSK